MLYGLMIILSLIGGMVVNPVRNLIAGNKNQPRQEAQAGDRGQDYRSAKDSPSQYHQKLSAAYLQKAYHSINQSLHYVEVSEKTKQLPIFDYARLRHDLERIKAELGKYLYPEGKDYGEAVKISIDGEYFLEEIRKAAKPGEPEQPANMPSKPHKGGTH